MSRLDVSEYGSPGTEARPETLKSEQNSGTDDKVIKPGGRAGGEVAAFDVHFDGQIRDRFDADASSPAVNKVVTGEAVSTKGLVTGVGIDIGVEKPVLIVE